MLDLMTVEAQRILRTYYDCVRVDDTYRWVHEIADDLIALAKPHPRLPHMLGDRANCPLCGGQAQTPFERGFAIPDGLRWHLEGSHKCHRCPVIDAAVGIADGYWDEQFQPRGSVAREAQEAALEKRRKNEDQYQIHPYVPARLLDEGLRRGEFRQYEDLVWAEERLLTLGFRTPAGRLRTYTRETMNAVVYADPRQNRYIVFAVFLKPFEPELPYWEQRRVASASFRLLDARKNAVEKKVDDGIAAAVRELSPGLRAVN